MSEGTLKTPSLTLRTIAWDMTSFAAHVPWHLQLFKAFDLAVAEMAQLGATGDELCQQFSGRFRELQEWHQTLSTNDAAPVHYVESAKALTRDFVLAVTSRFSRNEPEPLVF